MSDEELIEVFDIVEIVTNKRQPEADLATVLEFTRFEGEDCALVQYHYNSCPPQLIGLQYMKKH